MNLGMESKIEKSNQKSKQDIIILDTETTGLDPQKDKIIEIGCVKISDRKISTDSFQVFINPGIEISEESQNIHGITNEFIKDKPKFESVYSEFSNFIKDSILVAHNASFDMSFLNAEIKRLKHPILKNEVIDTLKVARKKFPGSPANLNALAKRFNISLHERDLHGALIDANILAKVYLCLTKPIASSLFAEQTTTKEVKETKYSYTKHKLTISNEEKNLHLDSLKIINAESDKWEV
ncbi:DNA polymerase III subunit epsilon [Candidatus Nesciobacter abundans]|uniref:DNA polymerase III subunit epsilon n=1 Tax=Candidatus Nesciobacter abundans TaxID=2601668 RepID=A0A5C0UGU6_9PROT|nr:DNA polymerase III subunit epsilon [Candidatus Nesciobacter abundans]QEK39308.1 DNA polymerase III subunit epsilon [Candidatus Nesciobacter abundans]